MVVNMIIIWWRKCSKISQVLLVFWGHPFDVKRDDAYFRDRVFTLLRVSSVLSMFATPEKWLSSVSRSCVFTQNVLQFSRICIIFPPTKIFVGSIPRSSILVIVDERHEMLVAMKIKHSFIPVVSSISLFYSMLCSSTSEILVRITKHTLVFKHFIGWTTLLVTTCDIRACILTASARKNV